MHVKMRQIHLLQRHRLFLEFHDLQVQRYSGEEKTKQSLHFENCFEYKEYIVNI